MQISFNGLGCFTLRGKNATIVTDPFDPKKAGVSLKKLKADIITLSREDDPAVSTERVTNGEGTPIIVSWPGEYEHKGVSIIGIQTWQNKKGESGEGAGNTVYTFYLDDIHICHLGKLGHALTTEQIDEIGDVDILLLPVGGIGSLDIGKALEVAQKIEPRIVVPMYFEIAGATEKLPALEKFLKAAETVPEKTEALKISKRELPAEEQTKFIVIQTEKAEKPA